MLAFNFISENLLKLLNLLLLPKCWGYKYVCVPQILFYAALEMESTAFCMLSKHPTNWDYHPNHPTLRSFTKEAFCKLDSVLRNVCLTTGR